MLGLSRKIMRWWRGEEVRNLQRSGRVLAEEMVVLDPGLPADMSRLPEVDSITEQFRAIRTNLLSIPREKRPRLISLTSTRSGEGTTHVLHRLGASLAERGDLRVLLLDGNLRHPRLDRYLAGDHHVGLADVLRGEAEIDDCVRETVIENMDILPSGTVLGTPAELLSSPALPQLLRDLRDDYDFVLIDTPAVERATDASILGALSDAVMLVVRLHATPQRNIRHAVDALTQARASVLGCVITGDADVPRGKRRSRYENRSPFAETAAERSSAARKGRSRKAERGRS